MRNQNQLLAIRLPCTGIAKTLVILYIICPLLPKFLKTSSHEGTNSILPSIPIK